MAPHDDAPEESDLGDPFSRWTEHLGRIESEFAAPRPEPMRPGTPPGGSLSPEWIAEMERRNERLEPLVFEMARAFEHRLDAHARCKASELIRQHTQVEWQLPGVISRAYERFLDDGKDDDLRLALALTALYDARAMSRDFLRIIIPVRTRMKERGLDAGRIFDEAVAQTNRHEDPVYGAHGLFLSLGRRWEEEETRQPSSDFDRFVARAEALGDGSDDE